MSHLGGEVVGQGCGAHLGVLEACVGIEGVGGWGIFPLVTRQTLCLLLRAWGWPGGQGAGLPQADHTSLASHQFYCQDTFFKKKNTHLFLK